ncbi:MAG: 30S ribosomal protein S3 [Patescibacteria group bacterium]|nr:30S ribosomal protein S3 [Patescibacteria group bacterium]MCL5224295.1 30S ribosomal protein S3 [Patescibacteria group bacterium]
MARKIRPDSYRLGVTKEWESKWISPKNMAKWLEEDERVRDVIMKKIGSAGVAKIEIERLSDRYKILIKASRPGLIIGRGGKGIEDLTKAIEKILKSRVSLSLNVEELKRTELSARVAAQNMAWEIEKRTPFRRVIKKALESFFQHREVQGAKVQVSGRLNGSEIARTEWLTKGKLPLSTLRADIDYGQATAFCTYGAIGVKVWIYKGEIFSK